MISTAGDKHWILACLHRERALTIQLISLIYRINICLSKTVPIARVAVVVDKPCWKSTDARLNNASSRDTSIRWRGSYHYHNISRHIFGKSEHIKLLSLSFSLSPAEKLAARLLINFSCHSARDASTAADRVNER